MYFVCFFFIVTSSAEIYTLSLHALFRSLDLSLVEVGVEHVDRELDDVGELAARGGDDGAEVLAHLTELGEDRKSTRLNSSHGYTSYAVFCLKKKIPLAPTFTRRGPTTST